MQIRGFTRLGALIALSLFAVGMTIVACRDTTTPTSDAVRQDDALMTRQPNISAQANEARARLIGRNPHDWVGVAHNRALNDLRKEMRKPGVLTRDMCRYMLDFIVSPDRLPAGKSVAAAAIDRKAAIAGLATTSLCRGRLARASHASLGLHGPAALLSQEAELSSAAYSVLSGVPSAIDIAVDRFDLAARLNQVLDASAGLDPVEQEVVGATVSVAQHSFEYWETELATFQQEFWGEYGECANQYAQVAATSAEARRACVEGDGALSFQPRSPNQGGALILALGNNRLPLECGLTANFRKLGGADATGAIVGAVKGIFGGGILSSALQGAGYASFASFIVSTWDLYWCAME